MKQIMLSVGWLVGATVVLYVWLPWWLRLYAFLWEWSRYAMAVGFLALLLWFLVVEPASGWLRR